MSEEKTSAEKPKEVVVPKEAEKPKEKPKPKPPPPPKVHKEELRSVESWAVTDPVEGITATMVLAQGRWAQGKEITQKLWRSTANAILSTPIGFKN